MKHFFFYFFFISTEHINWPPKALRLIIPDFWLCPFGPHTHIHSRTLPGRKRRRAGEGDDTSTKKCCVSPMSYELINTHSKAIHLMSDNNRKQWEFVYSIHCPRMRILLWMRKTSRKCTPGHVECIRLPLLLHNK